MMPCVLDFAAMAECQIGKVFAVSENKKMYFFRCDQILYVEAYQRRLKIYTEDGEQECSGSMKTVCEQLGPLGFVKTHQSFLVNVKHIRCIGPEDVTLVNKTKILLSRANKASVYCIVSGYVQNTGGMLEG